MNRELTEGIDARFEGGPGEDDRGPGRPRPAWLVPAFLLVLALAAAHSIETLNDYVGARSESRYLLRAVEDDAAEQQLASHEALLEGRVTPEIREELAHERREIRGSLSELERLNPNDARVPAIREALGVYEAAVDEEFRLIEEQRFGEARVADEQRTDPGFEELNERMEAADAAYAGSAVRTDLAADWGTYATTLLGAAALATAFGRYRRGLRSKEEALERSEARFRHRALHDPLTALPNRALLLDRLKHALKRADRDKSCVAVLFLDLDDFKVVNDSLGHEAGDELLVEAAGRLETCLRPGDTLARLGGDEFVVLLEDVGGMGEATAVAGRVAEALRRPFSLCAREEVFVSASIGVALCAGGENRTGGLPDDLLRRADMAMYEAKRKGKAHHEVFEPRMDTLAMERLRTDADLRRAIERGEFRVHYQPEVELSTGRVVGFEALVRWEHPEHGLVRPDRFISVAEETGLIVPIGRWVLEEACRQAKEWREQRPNDSPLSMSVNLSAKQFGHPELARDVARALGETGAEPASLVLEITESAVMEDARSTIDTLRELKALGVGLAIDDFGTGYSSLSYLRRFPVDYLKIDRSFVDGLGDGSGDAVLVSGIVDLAQALGLKVVAEGVETEGQLGLLREMGCELAQGYHFAKPLPGEEAGSLLAGMSARVDANT